MTIEHSTWRKSSRSEADGACVEIAHLSGDVIGVRDSKAPMAGHVVISRRALAGLIAEIKADGLDL